MAIHATSRVALDINRTETLKVTLNITLKVSLQVRLWVTLKCTLKVVLRETHRWYLKSH